MKSTKLRELGVKIETNVIIGKSVTIDELMDDEGFEAVFIGSGAGLPKFMGIPGENAKRCILCQRVPYKKQPDEGVPTILTIHRSQQAGKLLLSVVET